MADDMANGTTLSEDTNTRVGILSQRTANLEGGFIDFRREVSQQFTNVNASVGSLNSKIDERFNALANSLSERSKPQWQALGVMVTIIVVLGGLVYWPIRESTNDLKSQDIETGRLIQALTSETGKAIQALAANTVSRQEMDWRAARGAEDRTRTDGAIASIRDGMVYRNEWMERNLSRDHDIENIRADAVRDVANVQRQLDQQRSDFQVFSNSLGNGRDFLLDLKNEQRRLSDQIASLTAKVAAEQSATPR